MIFEAEAQASRRPVFEEEVGDVPPVT